MSKFDFFCHIVIMVLAVGSAIGCIGAFFYNWTWHNLFLGGLVGVFALFYASEVAEMARKANNFNEKGGQK